MGRQTIMQAEERGVLDWSRYLGRHYRSSAYVIGRITTCWRKVRSSPRSRFLYIYSRGIFFLQPIPRSICYCWWSYYHPYITDVIIFITLLWLLICFVNYTRVFIVVFFLLFDCWLFEFVFLVVHGPLFIFFLFYSSYFSLGFIYFFINKYIVLKSFTVNPPHEISLVILLINSYL